MYGRRPGERLFFLFPGPVNYNSLCVVRHQCEQVEEREGETGYGVSYYSMPYQTVGRRERGRLRHNKRQTTAGLVVVGALEMDTEETGCWRSQPNELFDLHVG
ncbi:hypothetical protein TESG_08447 [Trichophyton tonsurans CBS 112818]|uniref:Uncharacterized protein n=2 Tax=Trichophyton TaxID=5550 RepID=F2Q233_TRIEC|nr:hypothetical protein TESG_08447 [Trichophyton tonsurans CBS 112818]EGE08201.1 hypothetical protein TEQG_07259 [Trichophyton equinum CBS 127.97]